MMCVSVAETDQDIQYQESILSRFDTFLILPLFGPPIAKRRSCQYSDCRNTYLFQRDVSIDGTMYP